MKAFRRVFALVSDCHAASGHYQALWRHHFYEGLAGGVATVVLPRAVEFDWVPRHRGAVTSSLTADRARVSERLWQQILQAHQSGGLDAVISYCFAGDIEPDLVKQAIGLGIPWINFYCDSTHRFSEIADLARVTSLNWFPEHAALPCYQALETACLCAPFALNPDHLPDLSCRRPQFRVGFVGVPSANRITRLGGLYLLGCAVEIRGHGWGGGRANPFFNPTPRYRRFLSALRRPHLGEKIARRLLWPLVRRHAKGELDAAGFGDFLGQCQVMLGLNQGRDEQGRLASYLKFRDVEFPGYGCCYLTEHNEDVAAAFDVGREILTFRTLPEAAAEVRALVRDSGRRREVARAGRQRVLSDHTWSTRLRQLAARL